MVNFSRDNLCIYLDLENISKTKNINISKIMKDIIIKYDTKNETEEPIFVFKIACGDSVSIGKYREQLKDLNFEIKEAPHIVSKKNRSDLIISLDAFEKLYLDKPTIDEFIFITNDSDFSVIMDILRRYGKKVVLVTTNEDSKREIFNNSSDKILLIEQYTDNEKNDDKITINEEKIEDINNKKTPKDELAEEYLINIFSALDPDDEYPIAKIASKFKNSYKTFDVSQTTYKKFGKLMEHFQEVGIVKIGINEKKDKIVTLNIEHL